MKRLTKVNTEKGRDLPERELAFFGTIAASMSHELANVVSTLDQGVGLLKDMIESAERGHPANVERLRMLHTRLSRQTERGSGLIQALNRFSHSADDRHMSFELNALLKTLVAVSHRFADLKEVNMEVNYSEDPIQICSDPYALQHAVFLGLERALEAAEANDTIELVIHACADAAQVLIKGPAGTKAQECEPRMDLLKAIVSSLPGEVLLKSESGFQTFELSVFSETA